MTELQADTELQCLNCEADLSGAFCQNCGQRSSTTRISFKETIQHFFSYSFSLEGPLFRTIGSLLVRPGVVFREFIGGKRQKYYKPIQFYILLTAVYIILRALINFDPLEGQTAGVDAGGEELRKTIMAASRYMVSHINNIMFILVFVMALMMKIFFRKSYNLAEYTSIAFYTTGIYVLVGIILIFIQKYLFAGLGKFQLLILAGLIYFHCASLFKRKTVWPYFKYLFVVGFSLLLYIALGFGLAFLIVSLQN